jgi:nicotinamide-nucleotide amidase
MAVCELLSVGTELILGDILNTNTRFLSQALAALGIAVQRHGTVGDNPERLAEDLRAALVRSRIVILTGGLGPTADDITKEVVCAVLGIPLVLDARQMAAIERFFRVRGAPMGETNRKQALVPEGCTVLYNDNGTAPGCWIPWKGNVVVLLPGPPREMEPMFREKVVPLLRPFSSGVIVSHQLRTVGLGESLMAERAGELLDGENPTVAPYAKDGESYLRITAAAPDETQAEALCAPVIGQLAERLRGYVYGIDQLLEEAAVKALRQAGKTVALAESCTGGGISTLLTEVPGASEVFGWGVVSYANECKQALLGVREETLRLWGAVSEPCAKEMAEGIRAASGADFGLAVTGIAGPGSSNTDKSAGLIWLAIAGQNGVRVRQLSTGRNDRRYNRTIAAKQALALLLEELQKKATPSNGGSV